MVGKRIFMVDTGPGSANNLSLWGFPMERTTGVLLTHFHSDHIGDLGEFRMLTWTAGRFSPLPVYGPDGVDKVVAGFNLAYQADDDYRGTLHGLPSLMRHWLRIRSGWRAPPNGSSIRRRRRAR